jgi:hypothetical protein
MRPTLICRSDTGWAINMASIQRLSTNHGITRERQDFMGSRVQLHSGVSTAVLPDIQNAVGNVKPGHAYSQFEDIGIGETPLNLQRFISGSTFR